MIAARPMSETNVNSRLEAFSDGVFAIALTLLIIDIKIPSPDGIAGAADLWRALGSLAPSAFAFVLSFAIILITWVNHSAALRLVNASSPPFVYANGFLLLSVVFIPFPTSLLGAFLLTDRASPAVVLYNAVLAIASIGWVLVAGAARKGRLARDEQAAMKMRASGRHGYGAFVLYSMLAIAAFWFPTAVAAVTTMTWIYWLVFGIRMKDE